MRKVDITDGRAEGVEGAAPDRAMAAHFDRPSKAIMPNSLISAKPVEGTEEAVVDDVIGYDGHIADAVPLGAGFAPRSRQGRPPRYPVAGEIVLGKLWKIMPDGVPPLDGARRLEGHPVGAYAIVKDFKALVEKAVAKYNATPRGDMHSAAGLHG